MRQFIFSSYLSPFLHFKSTVHPALASRGFASHVFLVREIVQSKPVLQKNDAKRILQRKRRFGTRFRENVITNKLSTQNDGKGILKQKPRSGIRFGEAVQIKQVFYLKMMENGFSTKDVVLALDLEKQYRLSQFYQKRMQNASCTINVVSALDLDKQLQLTQFYQKLMKNSLSTRNVVMA